jgi:formate/nitrite transporter FocA (FNT family)
MYCALGLVGKKSTYSGAAKNIILSYLGNFLGSAAVAFFLAYLTDLFDAEPLHSYTKDLSIAKCQLGWGVALLRGVGCNMLVCLGNLFHLSIKPPFPFSYFFFIIHFLNDSRYDGCCQRGCGWKNTSQYLPLSPWDLNTV